MISGVPLPDSVNFAASAVGAGPISLPGRSTECAAWRVALVTNCITPYMLPVLQILASRFAQLQIFLSTSMEQDRQWKPSWDGLQVRVQRNFSLVSHRRFEQGFTMKYVRHFPYDLLPLLYRYQPDLVISSQLGFRTMQAALYRKLIRNSRLVLWIDVSEHTEQGISPRRNLLRRCLLHSADAIVATGHSGRRYLAGLGSNPAEIELAPYSTDLRLDQSASTPRTGQAAHRLLYVGQLVEGKGVHLLLRALRLWGSQNPSRRCELSIAGDGPQRASLASLPVPPNVHVRFFGNVPYSQLPNLYAQSGIFVFPTLSDTWGLVVNEALGAGLPVIGSVYSQAVQELVRPGFNGWTFSPENTPEFVAIIDRALGEDGDSLNRMRSNARSSVAHLDAGHTAEGFLRASSRAMSRARQNDLDTKKAEKADFPAPVPRRWRDE